VGELFARGSKAPAVEDAQKVIDDLHRKIGQLQVERDFLAEQPAISRLLRGGRSSSDEPQTPPTAPPGSSPPKAPPSPLAACMGDGPDGSLRIPAMT
jgi:hypothetical protein